MADGKTYNVEDLKEFAKFIKANYSLGVHYGGMFSSELCPCDPPADLLVDMFINPKKYEPTYKPINITALMEAIDKNVGKQFAEEFFKAFNVKIKEVPKEGDK